MLQIPSEEVFTPQKNTSNSVSEGVWGCRDISYYTSFTSHLVGGFNPSQKSICVIPTNHPNYVLKKYTYLPIYLSTYLSIYRSIYLSISIYIYIYIYIYLSIYPSIYPSIHLSIYLIYLYIYLYIYIIYIYNIYIYIYINIYINIYIYIETRNQPLISPFPDHLQTNPGVIRQRAKSLTSEAVNEAKILPR